jgi:CheY-like chemotaxis protein
MIKMRMEKTVLLIDDDKDDLQMLEEALKTIDKTHKIVEAHDGVEGLAKLKELIEQNILPCLIVLDLNMPKMDGKETFLQIKANKQLAKVPLVVLSTSNSLLDKTFFERHNTTYFVKPVKFVALARTASRMINMCFQSPDEPNELQKNGPTGSSL